MNAAGDIVMEGYLLKMGKIMHTWRSRWFELKRNHTLHYYKERGDKLIGSFSVNGCKVMRTTNLNPGSAVEEIFDSVCQMISATPKKNFIKIITPTRVWYLQSVDNFEFQRWLDCLEIAANGGVIPRAKITAMIQNNPQFKEAARQTEIAEKVVNFMKDKSNARGDKLGAVNHATIEDGWLRADFVYGFIDYSKYGEIRYEDLYMLAVRIIGEAQQALQQAKIVLGIPQDEEYYKIESKLAELDMKSRQYHLNLMQHWCGTCAAGGKLSMAHRYLRILLTVAVQTGNYPLYTEQKETYKKIREKELEKHFKQEPKEGKKILPKRDFWSSVEESLLNLPEVEAIERTAFEYLRTNPQWAGFYQFPLHVVCTSTQWSIEDLNPQNLHPCLFSIEVDVAFLRLQQWGWDKNAVRWLRVWLYVEDFNNPNPNAVTPSILQFSRCVTYSGEGYAVDPWHLPKDTVYPLVEQYFPGMGLVANWNRLEEEERIRIEREKEEERQRMAALAAVMAARSTVSYGGGSGGPLGPARGCGGTCKISKSELSRIYGKIMVVDAFGDYKVKVVESFGNLKVKFTSFPNRTGEWELVDHFPDYKIELVEHFEDFSIEYSAFPGLG